jgi:hypothetical protein
VTPAVLAADLGSELAGEPDVAFGCAGRVDSLEEG